MTKIHMKFDVINYKELIKSNTFDTAISQLGSNGHMTEFGFGGDSYYGDDPVSQSILDLIKGPTFNKLQTLTTYDRYTDLQLEQIARARKDTLKSLHVRNQNWGNKTFLFLQQCKSLTSLICNMHDAPFDATHWLPKLDNLSRLQLTIDDDFYSEQNCLNLTKAECLPNLKRIALQSSSTNESDYNPVRKINRTVIFC